MAGISSIDHAIRTAVQAHGYHQSLVARQVVRPSHGDGDTHGEWFVLFVDGEVWGRRRTRSELLTLAKRGPLCATQA